MALNLNQMTEIKQALLNACRRGDVDGINVTMNQVENLFIQMAEGDMKKLLASTPKGFVQLSYYDKLRLIVEETPLFDEEGRGRFYLIMDAILLAVHEQEGSVVATAEKLGLKRTTAQERLNRITKEIQS